MLLADAAGVVTGLALGIAIDDDAANRPSDVGLVGSAWYGVGAVAAPSVHFVHGGFGSGAASFGVRTLLPPLAGVIGLVSGCIGNGDFDEKCRSAGVTGGTLVGLVGAAAYDAAFLSFQEPPSASSRQLERHWYGWQLLVMDGSALLGGVYLSARPPRNEDGERLAPQLGLWASDYLVGLFGGPIVHLVHGEWQHGLASLGARALVGPLGAVAGLMGHCAASAGETGCANTGATYGLLGGLLLVDMFDAFVLGYEDVEREAPSTAARVSFAPGFIAVSGFLP